MGCQDAASQSWQSVQPRGDQPFPQDIKGSHQMANKNRTITSSVRFGVEPSAHQAVPNDDSAFRILVIGDLGGVTSFHTPVLIDCDDLDKVIHQLQVHTRVHLNEGDPAIEIPFTGFGDFHPDRLFSRLSVFEAMRSRRQRLQNESTCQQEIAAIIEANTKDSKDPQSALGSSNQPAKSRPNAEELLSDVLNITQAAQKPLVEQVLEGVFDWDNYVRHLVAPYVVSKADPRQSELIAGVDAAVADTMRAILHNSAFQRLEATWQGIRFLTRRLETNSTLQLSVMHVAPGDFQADLLTGDDLTPTKLFKVLVDDVTAEGATPWSLVVGDFQFGISPDQSETLARVATICEAAGTIFASGAAPEIAGCEDFVSSENSAEATDPRNWTALSDEELQRWNHIRKFSSSRHVVLALPKLLARRPYGLYSDEIESFVFDEVPDGTRREHYLWMNAAFGIAAMFGSAFATAGRNFALDIPGELEQLPVHVFQNDGDEQIQYGTVVALSDRAAAKFAECGLTVFRAVRNEESIRVATVRTLSATDPDLPGY